MKTALKVGEPWLETVKMGKEIDLFSIQAKINDLLSHEAILKFHTVSVITLPIF